MKEVSLELEYYMLASHFKSLSDNICAFTVKRLESLGHIFIYFRNSDLRYN